MPGSSQTSSTTAWLATALELAVLVLIELQALPVGPIANSFGIFKGSLEIIFALSIAWFAQECMKLSAWRDFSQQSLNKTESMIG